MAENKVQFNLKNVHYALLNVDENGDVTFDTPVHVSGAVNLSLEAQGEVTPFYADGITYYQSTANNGYNGDLEMARIPDEMLIDVWGLSIGDTSKVITENANVEPKSFALLFEIDGDKDQQKYVMYNCTGTRPAIASTTNTETKEPQTQTTTISAIPLANGNVMARTTHETPNSIKNAWFDSVFFDLAPDAHLQALSFGSITLTPTFDSDVFEYTGSTTNSTNTITATPEDDNATVVIKHNGSAISGTTITWETGENTVDVEVTNGISILVYSITITKS